MTEYAHLYIDGAWVPASGDFLDVIEPATEQVAATIRLGDEGDVDRAVAAARAALPAWSATPLSRRVEYLLALAAGMRAARDELADLIATEMGAPIGLGRAVHVGLPASVLESHADVARELELERRVGTSIVTKEPRGVVAAITPWNYPLHQIVAKLAPALAAGCTVVLKPSVEAPLSTYRFFRLLEEIGLPRGVVNLVTGRGREVGEALVRHPGVDMVSFTGSTEAGRRIGTIAADLVRPVTLELGGKSANVILDDADLPAAIQAGVANAFLNAGQTCSAWTRMIVPASRRDEAVDLVRAEVAALAVGDPKDRSTRIGPLVSEAQRASVRRYIDGAIADGHTLVAGGSTAPDDMPRGWYVRPTVFADVDRASALAQEEVFGPVLAMISARDEDEAVAIANDSAFGLAGAVWSADEDRAHRVAARMQTGQIDVNGARFNPLAPFGGYKQSGIGREFGTYGVEEYLQVKSVQL
ncbi:aldehyde dehydrogenase family protein [Microbacterium sp. X-17]|uniref:aldehyde dehydrogenase family protein n=1 Tax=Microbacterium sp. X-17 TaxID=3144404 RepID=UPI0031F5D97F